MKAHELALVQRVADLTPTRLFGMPTEEIFIKMLVAHEHGVPLTSALSTVHVINQKPAIAPKLTWAKIVGHPELASYEEKRLTDGAGLFYGWRITLERTNGVKATREFTLDDANRVTVYIKGQKKKLIDKDNWQNYPEQMCQWRTLGYVQDIVFADVSQGLYRPEELGAEVDEGGEPMWSEVTTTRTVPIPIPEPDPFVSLPVPLSILQDLGTETKFAGPTTIDALMAAGYSADQIVVANGGRVPSTIEDCQRVAEILEEQDATG